MHFEGRDLKPFAEPVSAAELKEDHAYFMVQFVDDELLVPTVEPIVYLGANLHAGDVGRHYFQDAESHRNNTESSDAIVYSQSEENLKHIFEFEKALEGLMKCSMRRSDVQGSA